MVNDFLGECSFLGRCADGASVVVLQCAVIMVGDVCIRWGLGIPVFNWN